MRTSASQARNAIAAAEFDWVAFAGFALADDDCCMTGCGGSGAIWELDNGCPSGGSGGGKGATRGGGFVTTGSGSTFGTRK